MVQQIWSFILSIPSNLGSFAEWIFTPIEAFGFPPIAIFGIAGFSVMFGLHVLHLLNVVGG